MEAHSRIEGGGGRPKGGGLGRTMRRILGDRGAGEAPPEPQRASPASVQVAATWTDSHCHLQDDPDPRALLARARAAGVGTVVCVGTDAASSRRAVELAAEFGPGPSSPGGGDDAGVGTTTEVYATVGLHPHDSKAGAATIGAILADLESAGGLAAARVVAVGECGLDYHYDHSPRPDQQAAFRAQVELAKRHDLALVIHTREAWDDTFRILGELGMPERTVLHCFSGGVPEARRCLESGAYVSFSGIVTFASADELRAAAAYCPLDRLLVETDAPFLTPVPHRGRPNESSFVPLVGLAVAEAKGLGAGDIAAASSANAAALFGLGR